MVGSVTDSQSSNILAGLSNQQTTLSESADSFMAQLTSALDGYLAQSGNNSNLEINIQTTQSQDSGVSQFLVTVTNPGSTSAPDATAASVVPFAASIAPADGSAATARDTAGNQAASVNAPPAVPTFSPTSTYVPSGSAQFPGSTTASLDSFLSCQARSFYNPTSQENGTAMGDPTEALTQLANNYVAENPGVGSQADIQNLVSKYAGQYNTWAQQYQDYMKAAGSSRVTPLQGQDLNTAGIS